MSKINPNYNKLQAGYLFPEIAKRTRVYQQNNPNAKIIKLGIGDTTEPLSPSVVLAMQNAVSDLGKSQSYTGYGDSEGNLDLRKAISNYYKELGCAVDSSEVFVSDGAKSDCANIQNIFGESVIALQDPAYPVYVDSSVINGQTGDFNTNGQFDKLVYLIGNEQNGFVAEIPNSNIPNSNIPNSDKNSKVDLIYLCYTQIPTNLQ